MLAVDQGTGGPKVGLVSLAGSIAWTEHLPVPTAHTSDGGATQDAGLWWDLITASARRALASGVIDPGRVVAVSCTGQWASTVPVDGDGLPVGPCLAQPRGRGLAESAPSQDRLAGPRWLPPRMHFLSSMVFRERRTTSVLPLFR